MTMAHDLLTEPLLSWRDVHRKRRSTTLPGILARLADGSLGDFPRVRTHQLHPWSMFLTQLAAIALHRAGRTDPSASDDEWRAMLLVLTAGAHEPWCLVVDDLSKAAFFQPPAPGAGIEDWDVLEHPDDIDILVTSKAHDVKKSLLGPEPEYWAYSLVTLQTMQGWAGSGHNPISRMNGGYGNRARVGLAKDQTLAARFTRDLGVLLDAWPRAVERGFRGDGIDLVWTVPWEGTTSLQLAELSPHFIEVCSRVRCRVQGGAIRCAYTTTGARRSLPSVDNGDVGDPWIPIERNKGALTVGPNGFDYQLLVRLLLGDDYLPADAQAFRPGDPDPVLFIGTALARGQGKTEGLHERILVLPGEVRRRLGQPDLRAAVGRRAKQHVALAQKMRSKVLYRALKALALGEKVVEDGFDARVDEVFFIELFKTLPSDDPTAQLAWERTLIGIANSELQRAIDRCCLADAKRFKAIAHAEASFRSCLKENFPDAIAAVPSIEQGDQQGAHP